MERSKSFPENSCSYSKAGFGFEDRSKSYSFNGPSCKADEYGGLESSGNPEVKRRKRVAAYNMYATEGKLKKSFRNSFKWIKSKLTDNYYDDM